MTYHIYLKNYSCPECQLAYIPCTSAQKCPKCAYYDANAGQYRNFAKEVVQSMKAHKWEFGRYQPDAWAQSSLTEALQHECFRFFDHLEAGTSGPFPEMLELVQLDDKWEQKYQRELYTAVHEIWVADRWFTEGPNWKEKLLSKLSFLSRFLP